MSTSTTLSVCMIVKDEEPCLLRAIDSVSGFASEIIVIDTGSKDRTVEIARGAGATVGFFPWTDDFSAARNHSVARATGDWILVLDADEAATPEFAASWKSVLGETIADALSIPVRNVGELKTLAVTRLARVFRNGRGYAFEGRIHEDILPSVTRAGAKIGAADLPLVHYGYTSEEDARKGRHERNRALLEAEYATDPANPRVRHYLALEHLLVDDLGIAIPLLEEMLSKDPGNALAGWSASLLSDSYLKRGDVARSWEIAERGRTTESGGVACMVRIGRIALEEDDPATLEACSNDLLSIERAAFDSEDRRPLALQFQAEGEWLRGNRERALSLFVQALREFPMHGGLADRYVRRLAELRGPVRATLEAIRTVAHPVVMAVGVGTLVRAGEWTHAAALSAATPAQTLFTGHAYLRAGRRDEAIAIFSKHAREGALATLLYGLEESNPDLVAQGARGLPASWQALARNATQGERAPKTREWLVWSWIRQALEARCERAVDVLLPCIDAPDGEKAGRRALLLLSVGRPIDALELAQNASSSPDAAEVIGTLAYAHQDYAMAAEFFTHRAEHGNASVRVYSFGADAAERLVKPELRARFLAQGRVARPHSRAWIQSSFA